MKSSFLKESLEVSTGFLFIYLFLALDFFLVLKTDWDRCVPLCMTFEGGVSMPSSMRSCGGWQRRPPFSSYPLWAFWIQLKLFRLKAEAKGEGD